MGIRRHLADAVAVMPAQSPEDIHALLAAAVNAGDVDAFVDLHEPDADGHRATRRSPRQRQSCNPGRDSARLRPTAEIELVDKLQSGDLALTFARVKVLGSASRGTVVSRRQRDGTWRIALDNPLSP
jgi:ketosteroid isomerase-like protein